jgi:farnesol kinase
MSLLHAGPRTRSDLGIRRESQPWRSGVLLPDLSGKFTPAEVRRRFVHMTPGLLPFVLWLVPHGHPFSWHMQLTVALMTVGLGVCVYAKYACIQRNADDREGLMACSGYAGSVLAMLLLFPAHAELAMTVLAIIAFGDGFACFGGLAWGRQPIPWNRNKTVAGSICFVVAGMLMATLVYWGESFFAGPVGSPAPLQTAVACSAIAVLPAALAESIPSRINDNVRVGLAASLGLICAQTLLVGWN